MTATLETMPSGHRPNAIELLASIPVLLPVKRLTGAKRRLAGMLTPDERRALVLAMLEDVLAAVRAAGLIGYVLTPDPDVIAWCRDRSQDTVTEDPAAASLNAALKSAVSDLAAAARAVLVLLPDTPLVTPDDLRELVASIPLDVESESRQDHSRRNRGWDVQDSGLQACSDAYVALAPDRSGRGTNALLACPPSSMALRFGRGSLARHIAAAKAGGLPHHLFHRPGLALDVDAPADIAALNAAPGDTLTHTLLRGLSLSIDT